MESQNLTEGEDTLRQDMNRWVAQFAPLVMANPALIPEEITERVELIQQLRIEADRLMIAKSLLSQPEDAELLNTFQLAAQQLPQMEADLRRQLHLVSPGDPESRPCLTTLQDRLHENAARQQMGLATDPIPEVFEAVTNTVNWGKTIGIMLPALGAVAVAAFFHGQNFTVGQVTSKSVALFAATVFIVAMAFGRPWAFSYHEKLTLKGDGLILTKWLGPFWWPVEYKITLDQQVEIVEVRDSRSSVWNGGRAIAIQDSIGFPIHVGRELSEGKREELVRQINAYLAYQRSLRTESP